MALADRDFVKKALGATFQIVGSAIKAGVTLSLNQELFSGVGLALRLGAEKT